MSESKPRTWPKLPLKHRLLLTVYGLGRSASKLMNVDIVQRKISPSPTKPIKGVTTTDITIDQGKNIWYRLFTPSNEENDLPFIVYYHGGGFIEFSPDLKSFDDFCRSLARNIPAVVASVNYRLAPEFRCPAAYEDGFEALRYFDGDEFKNDYLKGRADLKKCFISGDSAGGNLAHHVAVSAAEDTFKEIKVRGLISFQPFFGTEERTESQIRFVNGPLLTLERQDRAWKDFLPEGSDRNHPSAYVYGPSGKDISGLNFPPTILFVGAFDPLQDFQMKYFEWLRDSGKQVDLIEYSNAFHGFYGVLDLPETSMAVKDVKEFIQKQLKEDSKQSIIERQGDKDVITLKEGDTGKKEDEAITSQNQDKEVIKEKEGDKDAITANNKDAGATTVKEEDK